ncbi:polyprotein [Sapelovirus A]|uniref:Genome polyprotein n=1 Tax=Sapelovirus A TaxID=686984 RepID=A0A6B9ULF9_9PICO|nr:polyprotein [Sapelovirus A]
MDCFKFPSLCKKVSTLGCATRDVEDEFCNWIPKRLRKQVLGPCPRRTKKNTYSSGPYTVSNADGVLYVGKNGTKFTHWCTINTSAGPLKYELCDVYQCGQVQSNQTGNKPQENLVNGNSNNITNINYYGSDYSQAWNPSKQQMDPSQFTKPVVDIASLLSGPALKKPSKEEEGYSDRIMQLTCGNTCITSQEAAQAVIAYGQWPTNKIDAAEHLDLGTVPGTSVDRFYTFDALNWTSTNIGEWSLPLPGGLSEVGMFGQNLSFHYLYRCGFCVHVQCNASKFHQGALLVAMIPEHETPEENPNTWSYTAKKEWTGLTYPTEQLTLFPHQIINLRTNNCATIVYPFINSTPSDFGLAHNFVTLVVRILVPLSYNTGASTVVPITVSVAPMNSCFAGLRSAVKRQGVPVRQIPGSAQFLSVQRDAGLPLYPEFESTHSFFMPGEVTNFLQVARIGTFGKFVKGDSTDDGIYLTVDVTQGSSNEKFIDIDLSLISTFFETTYLGRLAKMYTHYRGSIIFEFMFCGSQMATGKILMCYTPPGGSSPKSRSEAMLGTHVIWDLGLQSTLKFPVPFISSSQYRSSSIKDTTMSYCGWVSGFQQTAIVVPPGAPSTCQITCLVSAADNFCFRIPTDDEYYTQSSTPVVVQGMGDKLKSELEAKVTHTVESALHSNTQESNMNSDLSIQSGDAAALTAAEIGATSDTHGESQMELRATNTVFSFRETDLEYVLSRYFLYWEPSFRVQRGEASAGTIIQLSKKMNFNELMASNPSLTRWRAFTYWRFELDLVFIPILDRITEGTIETDQVFNVMFSPVGCTPPQRYDDIRWNSPVNPQLIFSNKQPPASFRIPFMSLANYYTTYYDGHGDFNFSDDVWKKSYGINPGNDIGVLTIKLDVKTIPQFTSNFRVKVYARPVNVRAFIPRPLLAYKYLTVDNKTVQQPITDSSKYYDKSPDQLGLEGMVEVQTNIGDRWDPEQQDWLFMTPTDMLVERAIDVWSIPIQFDKGPFSGWHWKDDIILVPYHACNDWYKFKTNNMSARAWKPMSTKYWWKNQYLCHVYKVTQIWVDAFRDIAFVRIKDENGRTELKPGLIGEQRVRERNQFENNYPMEGISIVNSRVFPNLFMRYYNGFQSVDLLNFKDHQQKDLISTPGDAEPGFCGGLLFFNNKAVGMLTAKARCYYESGQQQMTTFYTKIDAESLYRCVEITEKDDFIPGRIVEPAQQCDDLISLQPILPEGDYDPQDPWGANSPWGDLLDDDDLASEGIYIPTTEEITPTAEYQGVREWVTGIVEDTGMSFGDGLNASLQDGIDQAITKLTPLIAEAKTTGTTILGNVFTTSCVKLVIKVVCALIIYSNAAWDSKMVTALSLGTMLGMDFMNVDPFEWLKTKIDNMYAHQQGVVDWIKDFNAACTAAKGLEWVWQKISKFIDWVKDKIKKDKDPERVRFHEMLKEWPDMMKQFDLLETNRGDFSDDDVKIMCDYISELKSLANKFGVEKHFATMQIIRYHAKATKLLQSMHKSRYEPVALCIHGSPGTGKSIATEIIGKALSKLYDGQTPYSLPPDPKHFDGYSQQAVVLMDDLGQNPDGQDMSLFCQMVSTTAFIPPMASLEEKGTLFTSKFVCCSTNCNVLKPPTIMEPTALHRRFFFDLDIIVKKEFSLDGKLDMSKCTHCIDCDKPVNFSVCNPIICGKALAFQDRRTKVVYSLDKIVTAMVAEQKRRASILNVIDAVFQGPTIDEIKRVASGKKKVVKDKLLPKEVVEVLRECYSDELVRKLESKGYMIPVDVQVERQKHGVFKYLHWANTITSTLGCIVSIGSLLYLLVQVFGRTQGPYSGNVNQQLKPPVRREAKVQGPDFEFARSIMKSNIMNVRTSNGSYSGLGIFDQWLVLPKHSQPMDTVEIDGNVYKIDDNVELVCTKGSLELICIKIKRNEKFRDIRKFLVESSCKQSECWLAINTDSFPNIFIPIGEVKHFGFLNLSMNATYNTMTYKYPTRSGQCGGIVLKMGKIIGMHIGGDGSNGYCALLKKSYFTDFQGTLVRKYEAPKPVNVKTKTAFRPSVFFDVFPGDKEPAVLKPTDKRLEVNFEDALFSKYVGNKEKPPEELKIAIDHYVNQIKPLMPENLTDPLTLEEVVYGIDHLEGLDLHTSAGYPYNTMGIKKTDLIPDKGEPLTKLTEALDLHGYGLPFTTYLKDELRPLSKVKTGKTRLIEASSINDTIRMKMVFGRLFQTFHMNPGTTTGSAVGCYPDADWSKFAAEIGFENICAFDYKNWDASLSPFFFDALKEVLVKLGYTSRVYPLIDHICNSTHIYRNTQYDVVGGMPSGCSGTSIFNSIINNLVVRVLVLRCYKCIDLDYLRILAYGDDLLISYPFPLDPAILAKEGKNLGLTMTPADKSDEFSGVKNLDEVTFLKRGFKPDEDFPFLYHPVFDMSEIYNSIRWTKNASTTQEHVRSLCELAWHSGKDVYEDFLDRIRSVPVGRALNLPAYSVLRQNWLDMF